MSILKKTATAKKATAKKATVNDDFKIVENLGTIHFNTISQRKNVNGNAYIPTPFGSCYANINNIKAGLLTVVKFKNGMIGLNTPSVNERMKFINEKLSEFSNMSYESIVEAYGL